MRTEQNDNDKAKKYFRDPAEILREKDAVLRGTEEEEGNALVEKLKAQTDQNKEKNRLAVERRTFENGQVSELGRKTPFIPQYLSHTITYNTAYMATQVWHVRSLRQTSPYYESGR